MNQFRLLITMLCVLTLAALASGCLSWDSGWTQAGKSGTGGDVRTLLDKAAVLERDADSDGKVKQLIAVYEDVLKADPENRKALDELGALYMLLGYGYDKSRDEKETHYRKALQYCERRMYLNNKFRELVDGGEDTWDAAGELSKDEMYALYFWYLSVGNYWLDCFSTPAKVLNASWTGRANRVLKHINDIDPDFHHGAVAYMWAVYYASIPGIMGRDLERSVEYFNSALQKGPTMTNFLVGRAKYLHTKKNDRDAFMADINRVLSIDPVKVPMIYPWAVYHYNDAKKMRAEVDRYF